MTVKFYLNDGLVATISNVTTPQTITAAGAHGTLALSTSNIDSRTDDGRDRDDYDWTLWKLTATPGNGYLFAGFEADMTRSYRETPQGQPGSYGNWTTRSSDRRSTTNPWEAALRVQTSPPYSFNIDGVFSGQHNGFYDYDLPSSAWREQTKVEISELRVYFVRTYTFRLVRNSAGTGPLRGDTTPLPLVDA